MPHAHLYVYSDACPTDWLEDGQEERWHTIVNWAFQSDPFLQGMVDAGTPPHEVLARDALFQDMLLRLHALLPGGLKKWGSRGNYKGRIVAALSELVRTHRPQVNACSFQEKTLRSSEPAILHAFNHYLQPDGRPIGFGRFTDAKGRRQMLHQFVNFDGFHEIHSPENQLLVLLLMAWFVADQYVFYRKHMFQDPRNSFDAMRMTVVSDKLSGDDDFRRKNERNLNHLIDMDGNDPTLALTRSPQSDTFPGDLLVDNLAGWLNAAVSEPTGAWAETALALSATGIWQGWYVLQHSDDRIELTPATNRLGSTTT